MTRYLLLLLILLTGCYHTPSLQYPDPIIPDSLLTPPPFPFAAPPATEDTTVVEIPTSTKYNWVLSETPISFHFADSTKAIEFTWVHDNEYWFSGISMNDSKADSFGTALVAYHNIGTNSIDIGISWTFELTHIDSMFSVWMTPRSVGTGFFGARDFNFDERGDDGVIEINQSAEIYPFKNHPFFVNPDGFVHQDSVQVLYWSKQTVRDIINEYYIRRQCAGDVTGNCSTSALDASQILRRVVGYVDTWPIEDPELFPTVIPDSLLQ